MSYVLTVVSNGNIEHVSLYAGFATASESAQAWAKALCLNPTLLDLAPKEEKLDDCVVWRFLESTRFSVSIRFLTHVENQYNPYVKGPHGWRAVHLLADPDPVSTKPLMVTVTTPNSVNVHTVDDALANHLPGGWAYGTNKPLTMKDLKDNVDAVLLVELTEEQKWALAQARVNKRPNVLFLVRHSEYPYCTAPGLYSQKYAIEELKNKSTVGLIIRNMELAHLHPWLGNGEESEDPQAYDYDESSSSDFF